jgi:hypothetical protein
MVEMQLNAALASPPDLTQTVTSRETPHPHGATGPPLLRDYGARRCHVCQCCDPPFGFGPPLTRPGVELWACAAHRSAVDNMLSGWPRPAVAPEQQQLSML